MKPNLNTGFNIGEIMRRQDDRRRLLDEFQVAQSGQLERAILQRIRSLIDDEHIENDVVLIDIDVGLGVDRIRESGQLRHLVQLGNTQIESGTLRRSDQSLR